MQFNTYDYLATLKKIKCDGSQINYSEIFKSNPLTDLFSVLTKASFYIIDHSTLNWVFVSDAILYQTGYSANDFRTEGFDLQKKIIHSDYFDFSFNYANCMALAKIEGQEGSKKQQVLYSTEYLVQKKDGSFYKNLQQSMILNVDANGKVVLSVHVNHDISFLKKSNMANTTILLPDGIVYSQAYNAQTNKLIDYGKISTREIEVIKELALGLESKQIAEKLFISHHTVDTHRRNLLDKFNCRDTSALIVYCKLCGII